MFDNSTDLRILELKAKKDPLIVEYQKLQDKVNAIGLSKKDANTFWGKIDKRAPVKKELTKRMEEVKQELAVLNKELLECSKFYEHSPMGILKKSLPPRIYSAIINELKRRRNGGAPELLDLDFTDKNNDLQRQRDQYKKLSGELINTLIECRKILTDVIQDGHKKFDQFEFAKIISPINRAIKPVSELEKIKRTNHL